MIATENKDIRDLLYLIRCALKQEPLTRTDFDTTGLFELAKKQQVYNIILPCLSENGLLDADEAAAWNNYYFSELQRTIIVNNEREAVCRDLDACGVRYMFTKGLIIREYYPKSFMRQMSDNDFLYDETCRGDLMRVMKKHGFYLGASTDNSDDFYKKPYCTFEFHRRLFNDKDAFCPDFYPLDNALPAGDGTGRLVMTPEDNYLYTVGHMYKHYACVSGCGVRFVCDIYLLSHSADNLDFGYINRKLEEFGITDFHATVTGLAEAIFEDAAAGKEETDLLDFLFEGNVYGKAVNHAAEEIAQYGSTRKYLWHRLFPSKQFMFDTYKTLQDSPWKLPFYYVYRLADKYRHNRQYMKRDLKTLKHTKQNKEDK